MERRWQRNLLECGLFSIGGHCAAHLLLFPQIIATNERYDEFGGYASYNTGTWPWLPGASEDFAWVRRPYYPLQGHDSFPFGYEVEENSPV